MAGDEDTHHRLSRGKTRLWAFPIFASNSATLDPIAPQSLEAPAPTDSAQRQARLRAWLAYRGPLSDSDTRSRRGPACGRCARPAVKRRFEWRWNAIRRFRAAVTETVGFSRTSGFVDDTRALRSIPARHDLSRRIDAGWLAQLVAEHQLHPGRGPPDRGGAGHRAAEEGVQAVTSSGTLWGSGTPASRHRDGLIGEAHRDRFSPASASCPMHCDVTPARAEVTSCANFHPA